MTKNEFLDRLLRGILKKGGILKTHVVRIYRQEKKNPKKLMGIVEPIGEEGKGKKAFTNPDELWEIINPKDKRRRERKKGRGRNKIIPLHPPLIKGEKRGI